MSNNWTVVLTADKAKFESEMKKAQGLVKRYSDESRRYLKNIDDAMTNLNSSSKWTNRLLLFTQAGNFGQLAQGVLRYADSYTELGNKLRLVTDSNTGLAQATAAVFDISLKTNQAVSATSLVYKNFAQNAETLGISQKKVAELTETVSKAVAVSGASSASAEAALTQFGQALASGVFRGDEFNSVMEQTPALAQAIAKGLGVTTGELRQMAKDGKLTSDVLVTALEKAKASVDAKFNTRVVTLSQSFTNLETRVTKYIGEADQAIGVTEGLAKGVEFLSSHLDELSRVLGVASVGLAGFYGTQKFKQHRNHINTISGNLNALKESQMASEIAFRQSQIEANLAREQLNVAQATRQKIANEIALNNAYRATSISQADKNRLAAQNIALAQQEKVAIDQLTAAQTRYNVAKNSTRQHFEQLRTTQLAVRAGQEQLARSTNLVGTAMTTAANGVKSFGAFLAANPLMLIGLIGTGIWQWVEHLEQTHQKALQFADNLSDIKEKMKEMDSVSLRATKAQLEESIIAQQKEVKKLEQELQSLQKTIKDTPTLELQVFSPTMGIEIESYIDNTEKLAKLQREVAKKEKALRDARDKLTDSTQTATNASEQLADMTQNELDAIYRRFGMTLIDTDRSTQDFNSSMLIAGNTATQVQSPLSAMMDKLFGVGDAARASAKDLYVFSHAARDALMAGKEPEAPKIDEKTQQAIDRIKRRNEINKAKGQDWVNKSVDDALKNQGLDPTKAGYTEMREALRDQFQHQLDEKNRREAGRKPKKTEAEKAAEKARKKAEREAEQARKKSEREAEKSRESYQNQFNEMTYRLAELKANAKDIAMFGQVSQYQEVKKLSEDMALNAEKYAGYSAEGIAKLKKLAIDLDVETQKVAIAKLSFESNESLDALEFGLQLLGKTRTEQELIQFNHQLDLEAAKLRQDMTAENIAKLDEEIAKIKKRRAELQATAEAARENWKSGMQQGWNTIQDDVMNVAENTKNITVNAFGQMSDAMTDFVMTGKADFRSMAQSILKDISNMIIKMLIFRSIQGALGGTAFGNFIGIPVPGKSSGGYVSGHRTFSVGGYTGDGGKYVPAGIVHRGEYVITKEATSRIGLDYLNYLNYGKYGKRGFASGGGVAVPRVPTLPYSHQQTGEMNNHISISVNIDQNGNTHTSLEQQAQQGKALGNLIQTKVLEVLAKERRAGGMLAH